MKIVLISLVIFVLIFGCISDNSANSNINFVPEYTFIITIDGARPDILKELKTPIINYMMENYNTEFSFNSQTVCPSITTSAHASLFTGLNPDEHQYYNPGDDPKGKTIFEIFKDNNYTTALVDGKGGRIKGLERGVDYFIGDFDYRRLNDVDKEVMESFIELFKENKPTLSFILLPNVDSTGHQFGHQSSEYSKAIEQADKKAVQLLLYYLIEENLIDNSIIIILADHGMTNKNHEDCLPTDMEIPIIKVGRPFKQGESNPQNITDISKEILEIYNLNFE